MKTVIKVPKGIRYISQWEEFYGEIFPRHPHILDKQIPGCGFTEWCLTNPDDIILCSPRNMLILNKWEQHPTDVFRVYNSKFNIDPGVDKELTNEKSLQRQSIDNLVKEFSERLQEMSTSEIQQFGDDLRIELTNYISRRRSEGKPLKILVTYDSFRILKDILVNYFGCFDSFQIIVDEMQSIFTDAKFKSNTEMEFISNLKGIQKICFLSATPMLDKYLAMIDEFSVLPYYELDWVSLDPKRVKKPNLSVRTVRSIYDPLKKIIDKYKGGKFDSKAIHDKNGGVRVIKSTEAMIFMNSVLNITNAIKKSDLKPEEVNILCANTPENQDKITKKLGRGYKIGKVPLPGEPRKMFTFCTRTVYLGADFYSNNAKTFIFSDSNIDCLAVDISLDLPQILGRQRLETNPWKNSAEFYYKPLAGSVKGKLDPLAFDKRIDEKIERSKLRLKNYESAPYKTVALDDIDKIAKLENYKDDYLGVNKHGGSNAFPEVNKLVMIAERRAYDIQQVDYADRFSVFDTISNALYKGDDAVLQETSDFLARYNSLANSLGIAERLKFICEAGLSNEAYEEVRQRIDQTTGDYLILGPDRIRAVGYNVTRARKNIDAEAGVDELTIRIYENFSVGDKLAKSDIKEKLKEIYNELGYEKTAKAIDIGDWFETRRAKINGLDGIELIKKKF